MILLAIMAMLGAAMGVFLRPRILAVPFAVAVGGGARATLGLAAMPATGDGQGPDWAEFSAAVAGQQLEGYPIMIGACLCGALIALALGAGVDKRQPGASNLPRRIVNGRLERAPGMVEERPQQKAAEARQKSLLGF